METKKNTNGSLSPRKVKQGHTIDEGEKKMRKRGREKKESYFATLPRKVIYDAEWHINLMNGFFITCPIFVQGANIYASDKNGNRKPINIICNV